MKIVYITNLSTFRSNKLLTLKIMDLENVTLTKVVHIYVIEGMMHNIYDIKSTFSQNVSISNMYC